MPIHNLQRADVALTRLPQALRLSDRLRHTTALLSGDALKRVARMEDDGIGGSRWKWEEFVVVFQPFDVGLW